MPKINFSGIQPVHRNQIVEEEKIDLPQRVPHSTCDMVRSTKSLLSKGQNSSTLLSNNLKENSKITYCSSYQKSLNSANSVAMLRKVVS